MRRKQKENLVVPGIGNVVRWLAQTNKKKTAYKTYKWKEKEERTHRLFPSLPGQGLTRPGRARPGQAGLAEQKLRAETCNLKLKIYIDWLFRGGTGWLAGWLVDGLASFRDLLFAWQKIGSRDSPFALRLVLCIPILVLNMCARCCVFNKKWSVASAIRWRFIGPVRSSYI